MYILYHVSQTGYYPVIQGSVESSDMHSISEIKMLIPRIMPGNGVFYTLVALKVSEQGVLTDDSRAEIIRCQSILKKDSCS